MVIAPILGGSHLSDESSAAIKSEIKKCSVECEKPCCSMESKNVVVDVKQVSSDLDSSSVVLNVTVKNGDTGTNKEIKISTEDLNIDSMVESEKSSLQY